MKNKMDGQQEKQPILLSFCLIMNFLIIGFSAALILLMALNMPKRDQPEGFEKIKFTGAPDSLVALIATIQLIADVMAFGLFTTFFAWITSMFCGIYSMTLFFGEKYNWPCCPQLKNLIQRELLGSPIKDGKNKNIKIGV